MTQELLYTSAPRGLKPGTRGFCTVLSTQGMSAPLATALEGLSGYRPLFPADDAQASRNPVNWSHLRLHVGGQTLHILSRIADYGVDYSQRANKLAHHVVLDRKELVPAGPAAVLALNNFSRTSWEGEPRLVATGPQPQGATSTQGVCRYWQSAMGDAGWAGVIADAFLKDPLRPVILLYQPGQEILPLFAEAISLLPPEKRWEVTFSTYFTGLAAGTQCAWRAMIHDSKEAHESLRFVNALRIDLTKPTSTQEQSELITAARTGHRPQVPQPAAVEAVETLEEAAPPIPGKPLLPSQTGKIETGTYSLKSPVVSGSAIPSLPNTRKVSQKPKSLLRTVLLISVCLLFGFCSAGAGYYWFLNSTTPNVALNTLGTDKSLSDSQQAPPTPATQAVAQAVAANDPVSASPKGPATTTSTEDSVDPDNSKEQPPKTQTTVPAENGSNKHTSTNASGMDPRPAEDSTSLIPKVAAGDESHKNEDSDKTPIAQSAPKILDSSHATSSHHSHQYHENKQTPITLFDQKDFSVRGENRKREKLLKDEIEKYNQEVVPQFTLFAPAWLSYIVHAGELNADRENKIYTQVWSVKLKDGGETSNTKATLTPHSLLGDITTQVVLNIFPTHRESLAWCLLEETNKVNQTVVHHQFFRPSQGSSKSPLTAKVGSPLYIALPESLPFPFASNVNLQLRDVSIAISGVEYRVDAVSGDVHKGWHAKVKEICIPPKFDSFFKNTKPFDSEVSINISELKIEGKKSRGQVCVSLNMKTSPASKAEEEINKVIEKDSVDAWDEFTKQCDNQQVEYFLNSIQIDSKQKAKVPKTIAKSGVEIARIDAVITFLQDEMKRSSESKLPDDEKKRQSERYKNGIGAIEALKKCCIEINQMIVDRQKCVSVMAEMEVKSLRICYDVFPVPLKGKQESMNDKGISVDLVTFGDGGAPTTRYNTPLPQEVKQ